MSLLKNQIQSYDYYLHHENMQEEVLEGLSHPQKRISSKFLYDHKGSELFEEITQLDEYYPTRTEMTIFQESISEITEVVGNVHTLIEYGSGSSNKIKALLQNFQGLKEYVPIDISREFLFQSCLELAMKFPHLTIKAVCGDYTKPLSLPVDTKGKKRSSFQAPPLGILSRWRYEDF